MQKEDDHSGDTLTRILITDAVQRETGLPRSECSGLVDAVLGAVSNGLVEDGQVKLSGFGTFTVLDKAPREGRNPKTGEPASIEARRTISFKASHLMRDRVDAGGRARHGRS